MPSLLARGEPGVVGRDLRAVMVGGCCCAFSVGCSGCGGCSDGASMVTASMWIWLCDQFSLSTNSRSGLRGHCGGKSLKVPSRQVANRRLSMATTHVINGSHRLFHVKYNWSSNYRRLGHGQLGNAVSPAFESLLHAHRKI